MLLLCSSTPTGSGLTADNIFPLAYGLLSLISVCGSSALLPLLIFLWELKSGTLSDFLRNLELTVLSLLFAPLQFTTLSALLRTLEPAIPSVLLIILEYSPPSAVLSGPLLSTELLSSSLSSNNCIRLYGV